MWHEETTRNLGARRKIAKKSQPQNLPVQRGIGQNGDT
jgi:hypothetical protein